MNRSIKFRGQREDTKEWVYGSLIEDKYIVGNVIDWNEDYFNTEYWWRVIPETVRQFTGLPSQDKEDIYEGDRLFDYDDDYYVVEFSEGRFVAVGDGFEVDLFEIADRCSVIGNVHDNGQTLHTCNEKP